LNVYLVSEINSPERAYRKGTAPEPAGCWAPESGGRNDGSGSITAKTSIASTSKQSVTACFSVTRNRAVLCFEEIVYNILTVVAPQPGGAVAGPATTRNLMP
jgi:hypothetical protein